MKRLLLALAGVCLSVSAQFPVFPSGIAGDSQLKIAANNLATTLKQSCSPSDTVLTVGDATRITAGMLLTIDREIVSVSAVSGNLLTVARGFDGTTATSHAAGRPVAAFIDAWHHNVVAAEIKAIESTLGTNLSNVNASGASAISTQYDFTSQTPGGSLVIGATAITLTPVPRGVNGTDVGHYLYVSGGTGTAEPCLITGGSGVSSASSGQIILTCSNTHSGAWSVRSATAGIAEAANSVSGAGGSVLIPAGTHTVFATTTVTGSSVKLIGQGPSNTIVSTSYTAGPIFYFKGAAGGNRLQGLQISGANSGTNYGVRLENQNSSAVVNVVVAGVGAGIDVEGDSTYRILIDDVNVSYQLHDGIYINGGGDHFISRVGVGCNSVITTNAIHIVNSSGSWVRDVDAIQCGNGLVLDPGQNGAGTGVNWLWVTDSAFDTSLGRGIVINPVGSHWVTGVNFVNTWTASSVGNGVLINNNTTGTVAGIRFIAHRSIGNQQHGFVIFGGSDIVLDANTITGNSATPSVAGTYHGVLVQPGVSDFRITNSTIGVSDGAANTQGYGIIVPAGASNNYVITGNILNKNLTGSLADDGTGTSKIIRDNLGANNVIPTVASGATLTLSNTYSGNDRFKVSGSSTVTTINGGWVGRQVSLIFTGGTPGGVATGGNIGRTQSAAQNQAITLTYDGTTWY